MPVVVVHGVYVVICAVVIRKRRITGHVVVEVGEVSFERRELGFDIGSGVVVIERRCS